MDVYRWRSYGAFFMSVIQGVDMNTKGMTKEEAIEHYKEMLANNGEIPGYVTLDEMVKPWEDEGALATMIGEYILDKDNGLLIQQWNDRAEELATNFVNNQSKWDVAA